jgi:hypothetical protein
MVCTALVVRTGDGDTTGIGNSDRAVPSNHLFGDRRAFRAGSEPIGDERCRKQAARGRFPMGIYIDEFVAWRGPCAGFPNNVARSRTRP